jgi:integrase
LEKLGARGQVKADQKVFLVRDPKRGLKAATARLHYPAYSSRALRRCFITRCIELGIDFKTIAAWQGHRDGGVLVAKTYGHLRSEHSENMARKLVDSSLPGGESDKPAKAKEPNGAVSSIVAEVVANV